MGFCVLLQVAIIVATTNGSSPSYVHVETSLDGPENDLFRSDFFMSGPYTSLTSSSVRNEHASLPAATADCCFTSTCSVGALFEHPMSRKATHTGANRTGIVRRVICLQSIY